MSLLEVKNIEKSFQKTPVLKGVSLTASSGICIGLLGSNGSGKSTLLSILAGVLPADKGTFLLDGKKPDSALFGYVPQGTPLMEELTAWDNLRLWYDAETLNKELSGGVLEMLGIGEFLKVPVRKLSGGMKKRLSIACVVVKKPPVLLLDEPGAALDLVCKQNIADYLAEYKKGGGTIVLTTHDAAELALCDTWYLLRNGRLEAYDYDGDLQKLAGELAK